MAFDDLRPTVRIFSSDNELSTDVVRAISRIEIDLARDIADQIKIRVVNPISDKLGVGYTDSQFVFLDSKAFQPGNRLDVYLGYGDKTRHVASGIIQKWLPDFPESGVPMLEIVALDGSCLLMDGLESVEGKTFQDFDIGSVVRDILFGHDIIPGDVTPAFTKVSPFLVKKPGMSDYQFLKGLALLHGFEFKVFWDTTIRKWKANWREPKSEQPAKFTFTYQRPTATLLKFKAQWGLRDSPNQVKVLYFDEVSRTFQEFPKGKEEVGESTKYKGGEDKVKEEIKDFSKIRVAAGDVAVDIVAERKFPNAEAAEAYALRWLKAKKDLFVTGSGSCVGLETLRAGDVHRLEGIGTQLTGDWEMTTVRHVVDTDRGYTTEFFANKVIGD